MRILNILVITKLLVLFFSSVAAAGFNDFTYTYYNLDGNLNDKYVDSRNGANGKIVPTYQAAVHGDFFDSRLDDLRIYHSAISKEGFIQLAQADPNNILLYMSPILGATAGAKAPSTPPTPGPGPNIIYGTYFTHQRDVTTDPNLPRTATLAIVRIPEVVSATKYNLRGYGGYDPYYYQSNDITASGPPFSSTYPEDVPAGEYWHELSSLHGPASKDGEYFQYMEGRFKPDWIWEVEVIK